MTKAVFFQLGNTLIIKALGSFYVRLPREAPSGIMDTCNAALQFPKLLYVLPSGIPHERGCQRSDGQIAWPMFARSVVVTFVFKHLGY